MQEPIGFDQSNILASAKAQGRSANFVAALAFLLPQEGVYFEIVDGDAGGATCCGVTQACFSEYLKTHNLRSDTSVEFITAAEVPSVYWEQNWNALGCDNLQYEVGLPVFDTSVNCGNREAILFEQRELGVDDDGVNGPATQAAEHNYVTLHGALALGLGILNFRRAYYDEIGEEHANDEQFEADWHRRCDDVEAAIKAASAGSK